MSNLHKKFELAANIAIIIVALLVCVVFVKRFVIGPSVPAGRVEIKQIVAGEKMPLPDVDWSKSDQTLLLVIAQGCHFCSDSAQFYQRLVKETAGRNDIRLIAVFPHGIDEGKRYLTDLGVQIDELRQASLDSIKVKGTPTLVLVDNAGIVKDTWLGQLPPEGEAEVLGQLQANRASR